MNTTTVSADTSTGTAAELLRDIQQRNYGAAETKARRLWHRLNEEAHEQRRAEEAARQHNTDEPDTFELEMKERIRNLNNAVPSSHRDGMRAGFMYARAIYRGTRK